MNSSDDAAGLAALLLLPFVIAIFLGYVMVLIAIGVAFVGLWIALGIGANLLVRLLIGIFGDALGASPLLARFGLATIFLAPAAVLAPTALTTLASLITGYITLGAIGALFLASAVLWVPAYYWAYFAEEVPKVHWRLELPFRMEASMRAEEYILRAGLSSLLSATQLRWNLWRLEHFGWAPRPATSSMQIPGAVREGVQQ